MELWHTWGAVQIRTSVLAGWRATFLRSRQLHLRTSTTAPLSPFIASPIFPSMLRYHPCRQRRSSRFSLCPTPPPPVIRFQTALGGAARFLPVFTYSSPP